MESSICVFLGLCWQECHISVKENYEYKVGPFEK